MRELHSYKSLFKIKFKVYEIGEKTLPVPIPVDAIIMTVVLYLPAYPFGYLLSQEFAFFSTLFVAGGAAYLFSECDLQGKFMPTFFLDLISFITRSKKTNFAGKKIKQTTKHYTNWEMGEV